MEDKILVERSPECTLLSLPTELLIVILEYVFHNNQQRDGFTNHDLPGDVTIDRQYSANHCLRPLLTCRRLYEDGSLLALSKTNFVVSNPFFKIPDRLALLHSKQVAAIRNIAFVANARHFRDLVEWRQYPFDMADLQLETLTVVLQATNFWHYLTGELPNVIRHHPEDDRTVCDVLYGALRLSRLQRRHCSSPTQPSGCEAFCGSSKQWSCERQSPHLVQSPRGPHHENGPFGALRQGDAEPRKGVVEVELRCGGTKGYL